MNHDEILGVLLAGKPLLDNLIKSRFRSPASLSEKEALESIAECLFECNYDLVLLKQAGITNKHLAHLNARLDYYLKPKKSKLNYIR